MVASCTVLSRHPSSNLLQCFPEEAWLLGRCHQLSIIFLCPRLIDHQCSPILLTILRLLSILGHGPRPNTLARLIYPHNNPSKFHLFSLLKKVWFDFCFQTSHAQWTFPRDNISSPALNTLLTLQHSLCPINCFIWHFVPHIQRCDENPTVEIFYGNSREKFLAPCAFLSKENGHSIYSIS